MQISLKLHDLSGACFRPEFYNYDPDDVREIIMDICDALEGCAEFSVGGFGEDAWPVDVGTDLAVCIEQIPNLLEKLKRFEECSLEFYEQGIEREIIFLPQNEKYLLSCNSIGNTDRHFRSEIASNNQLIEMFSAVLRKFLEVSKELDHDIVQKKIFIDWAGAKILQVL